MAETLNDLAVEAAAIDAEFKPAAPETALAESAGQDAAPTAPPPIDPVESLAGFLAVVAIAADYGGLKKTAAIWTPEACRGLADKLVPVLMKYTWGQRVLDFLATGAGAEEMALMAYAMPMTLATVQAVREDLKPARLVHQEANPQQEHGPAA